MKRFSWCGLEKARTTQQTQGIDAMLFLCWANVVDVEPTSKQHRVNALCLLGTVQPLLRGNRYRL